MPGERIEAERLLTVEELAERLQVPRGWVYERTRRAERNGLPVIRVGKYCRFDFAAVLEYLKTNGQPNR